MSAVPADEPGGLSNEVVLLTETNIMAIDAKSKFPGSVLAYNANQ